MARLRSTGPQPAAGSEADGWGRLMAQAQAGDQACYRQLLQEITPYLRILASRRLGPQEADDAVQDVLLSIHTIRHTYDASRPFRPWLATIAQRRLVDRLRQKLRRAANEDPLDVTVADERASAHENVLELRALRRAVDQLPARQKEAVQLLRLREMAGKEAAAASGRAEGALKVSLHRAIDSLRRMLGGS